MTNQVPSIPEPNLSSSNDELFADLLDSIEDETQPLDSKSDRDIQTNIKSEMFPDAWLDNSEAVDSSSINNESHSTPLKTTSNNTEQSELFVERWLDEPKSNENSVITTNQVDTLSNQVRDLEVQKQTLIAEIAALEKSKEQILAQQIRDVQENLGRMVEEGMRELKERKTALNIEIEKLEKRKERIHQEMRNNFAGASQDLAIRVQGFKDYLVGSLQDLASAAEQLQLPNLEAKTPIKETPSPSSAESIPQPQFAQSNFTDQERRIRSVLEQYRNKPDYYGSPWQLRRTFEPIHAERVQNWFFSQGGRGAIKSMGSRLQNILVASAIISVLNRFYGDRCRPLILSETPERLGEWRRGLQDCLGISRSDFSPNRGVGLFESPEALIQKAERLLEEKLLPLVIIDETEEKVNLSLLQFPLWLAFAGEPQPTSSNYVY
jgi:hypothetical protein